MNAARRDAARSADRRRQGAVLIEFALVSLLFVVLSGAIFDYARAFFAAQQLQRAGRIAAREVALLPLPPAGIGLADALACRRDDVLAGTAPCDALTGAPVLPRETVFDPDFLAIPCDQVPGGGCGSDPDLDAFFSTLPVVNQLLRPLMLLDRSDACPDPTDPPCLLRYPGALVTDDASATGFSVVIPVTTDGGFTCVPVVEPVGGGFGAAAGGLVSLRLNYPFQGAALLAWDVDGAGNASVIAADDPGECAGLAPGLTPQATIGRLPVATGSPNVGPNAGALGLGRQLAFGQVVRPFRRVISAEAAFRREVYL